MKKVIKLSELPELTRRESVKRILDARDEGVKVAQKVSLEQNGIIGGVLPIDTGVLAGSTVVESGNKYTRGIMFNPVMRQNTTKTGKVTGQSVNQVILNSLNVTGGHTVSPKFYTQWLNKAKKSFNAEAHASLKSKF